MNASNLARNVYPGWWIASGSCVSLGLVAGMAFWAFGLYLDPLHDDLGWSKAVVGAGVSVTFLVSGIASPIVGRLVERYGPKTVIAIGTAGTACMYAAMSQMNALWQFFVLLSVLAFFRTFIFYIPFTTLVTRWFVRRRATAMGIATSGFGFGGLVFLPVMALLVSMGGWRESLIAAAVMTVVINSLFLLFTRTEPPPEADASKITTANLAAREEPVAPVQNTRELARSPFFWCMAAGFSLFFFAQWAFLFHAVPFLENAGYSGGEAAAILSGAAGLGVLLRLSSGFLLDRTKAYEVLAIGVLLTMASALGLLMLGPSTPVLVAFVLMWGVGSGIGPLLEPMLVVRIFGRDRYASVYGWIDAADTIVAVSGPWLGSLILATTGGYNAVLGLYAFAFLISAGAFALLTMLQIRTKPANALTLRRVGATES